MRQFDNPNPLTTLFPPVPKTYWRGHDPQLEWSLGRAEGDSWHTANQPGVVVRGPHIDLAAGLYGVEFQVSALDRNLAVNIPVATAQATAFGGNSLLAETPILAGLITQQFSGMYQGARLTLILDRFVEDVEFSLISTAACPLAIRGIKLIPRPGRIWFPAQLEMERDQWNFNSDRSATSISSTSVHGPSLILLPGDYRAGIKFSLPPDLTNGPVAEISLAGAPLDTPAMRQAVVPIQPVTAEQVAANYGIPDTKLRFRLDEPFTAVKFSIRALVGGLTFQWLRLATADEAIWHHYYHLGGVDSALGPASNGFLPAGPSASGVLGSCRHFERGSIYWTIQDGPCEIVGVINDCYEALGGVDSPLGFPVSRPASARSSLGTLGTMQRFESDRRHGAILSHLDTSGREHVIALYGEIARRYFEQAQGPEGSLGFPISRKENEVIFEGGILSF